MSDMMEYKGYHAKPEYSADDGCLVGKILGIADTVVFDGVSVDEFEAAFRESVDGYLDLCGRIGKSPDKEYSGQFVLRVPPEIHKGLVLAAERSGESLNALVTEYCMRGLAHGAAAHMASVPAAQG